MAEKTGLTAKAIEKNLKTLRDNGIIRRIGASRGGSWEIGDIDRSRGKILDLIRENPAITTLKMAERTGLTVKAIEKNLKILRENGSVRRIGASRGGSWEIKK